jgi:hypothetical protein
MPSLEKQLIDDLASIYGRVWFLEIDAAKRAAVITCKGCTRQASIYTFDYGAIDRQIKDIGDWVVKGIDISAAEIIEA